MKDREIILNTKLLIEKLKNKNLKFKDEDNAIKILENISYFKIKEFTYGFLDENSKFIDNVYFEDLVNLFYFDKKLRFIVLDLVELIEITLKARLLKVFAKDGVYSYMSCNWASNPDSREVNTIRGKLEEKNKKILLEDDENEYKVIKFYKKKSKEIDILPIWVIMEKFTLGELLEIFRNIKPELIEDICNKFRLAYLDFIKVLENVKYIRNKAAHNNDILFEEYPLKKYNSRILSVLEILVYITKIIYPNKKFSYLKNILIEIFEKINILGIEKIEEIYDIFQTEELCLKD